MSLFLLQGSSDPGYFCTMFRASLTFVLFTFFSQICLADKITQHDPWEKWKDVRSSYDAGKFEEALHAIQSQPTEDSSYFYNLGTIYYRLGRLGLALGYLEKANRMTPHDPSIQQNLTWVRTTLSRSLGEEKLDSASTWLESIADQLSLDEVRGALGLVVLILALFWTRTYWKSRNLVKTLFHPAGYLGLVGVGITLGLYTAQRFSGEHPPAICIDRQSVRSGPGEHFVELAQVEAGIKLRLLGPAATSSPTEPNSSSASSPEIWRQVRYSTDGIGWIKASSLLLL